MDIAAMSIVQSLGSVQQSFSIGLLAKTMEQAEMQAMDAIENFQASAPPVSPGGIGYMFDVRA